MFAARFFGQDKDSLEGSLQLLVAGEMLTVSEPPRKLKTSHSKAFVRFGVRRYARSYSQLFLSSDSSFVGGGRVTGCFPRPTEFAAQLAWLKWARLDLSAVHGLGERSMVLIDRRDPSRLHYGV